MNKSLKLGGILLGTYIFYQAFIAIASFIGLSSTDYINYILWMIALILFWLFLPKKANSELFN